MNPTMLARIADATRHYPYRVWGFGESVAMEALLAAGGEPGAWAANLVRSWAAQSPPLADDPLAHVAPGVPLLLLYRQTGEPFLLTRARELARVLRGTRQGVHGARIHRPDLTGWEREVWVDCMHLDGPFLALLGELTGEECWIDRAAELLLGHARVLQDETTGLFSHGFDDGTGTANHVFWGRGQGWALLGLTDTLFHLPDGHPAVKEIRQRLAAHVAGLASTMDGDGTWHTVVDDPETYLEPSTSAFVALGVGRAVRRGQVNSTYRSLAASAWRAVQASLSPDGTLTGVSDATPVGYHSAHYNSRARGVFPWGQGPVLLAALEQLEE